MDWWAPVVGIVQCWQSPVKINQMLINHIHSRGDHSWQTPVTDTDWAGGGGLTRPVAEARRREGWVPVLTGEYLMGEQVSSLMIFITLLRRGTPLGATKWNSSWESSSYKATHTYIYIERERERHGHGSLNGDQNCLSHLLLLAFVLTLSVKQTPLSWELFSSM